MQATHPQISQMFDTCTVAYSQARCFFVRLDASGIIAGLKWLFPSHAMPFFSHLAQAKLLKKAFAWLKTAHFSHYTDPTHQVYCFGISMTMPTALALSVLASKATFALDLNST